MKIFLFRVWDINTDETAFYQIDANNTCEAQEKFVEHFLPLLHKNFDYESMVRMFGDNDVDIMLINIEEIIKLS